MSRAHMSSRNSSLLHQLELKDILIHEALTDSSAKYHLSCRVKNSRLKVTMITLTKPENSFQKHLTGSN